MLQKTNRPASSLMTAVIRAAVELWLRNFRFATSTRCKGDEFSKAVLENTEVPVPLEEAIKNMKVIEAIFQSGESGKWQPLSS